MNSSGPILVYTDGGAIGNPGPGAYGIVIHDGNDVVERSQGYRRTTNNRMEVMAVLVALHATADAGSARETIVYSDSRYVVDAIEKGWATRWEAQGWKRTKRGQAKNADLWAHLLKLLANRKVEFRWVKGHSGHPENERCDELVQEASRSPYEELKVDRGYEDGDGAAHSNEPALFGAKSGPDPDQQSERPSDFNHLDSEGKAKMVDVSQKNSTVRHAVAACNVIMSTQTLAAIKSGTVGKGDVLSVARTAGIMAAKRTSELIPMCHQIPLSHVQVDITYLEDGSGLRIEASAQAEAKTGVEMEALTAASVAALTVYDMCKSAERGIMVNELRLIRKSGGVHGDYSAR